MIAIEELESKIAEAEGKQVNKTANKVKQYLEEEIKDILLVPKNQKWNNNFLPALTKFNGEHLSDTESEAKDLLLEKFYDIIDEQVNRHLNAEKKEIIKIFENLWDKYKVSLATLKEERDEKNKKAG